MNAPSPARILAIDPGLTGAVAVYDPAAPTRIVVHDMPTADGEVNPAELLRLVREADPVLAVVEHVGPQPRDGVRQAFSFGGSFALAKAVVVLAGIPLHLVTPGVWKRAYRLSGGPEGKEASRALALRLFPASSALFARKRDHGRAEAALVARWATLQRLPEPRT